MKLRKLFSVVVLALFIFGCAAGQLSYYDNETYKNLTYLKPEVEIVYNTYGTEEPHKPSINHVVVKMKKMVEYEKWKGEGNNPTYEQILIIQRMFNRHLKERMESSPWSRAHIKNKLGNMHDAIDIAIKSELLKNKEGS